MNATVAVINELCDLKHYFLYYLTPSSLHLQTLTAPCRKAHHDININHYATKKTAAQSILHVALLMANSFQLKTLLYVGPQ